MNLVLRKIKNIEKDYRLLTKWYQFDYVYNYFEQRILNYNEIVNKYYPRTLNDSNIVVEMIEIDKIPIGIIQYKLLEETDKKLYQIKCNKAYEIDIYIGEKQYHGLGIGQKAINIVCTRLFNENQADLLIMCPLKENHRAINCYLKCQFVKKNEIVLPDTLGKKQEYILMIKENI